MKQDILSLADNKNVGTIELNESIFGLEVRADILHRVVNWQLARLQTGNHKTSRLSRKAAAMRVRVPAKVPSSEKAASFSVPSFVTSLMI